MKTLIFSVLYAFSVINSYGTDKNPKFQFRPANTKEQIPDSILVNFRKENVSMNYGREQLFKGLKPDQTGNIIFNLPAISHIAAFDVVFFYGNVPIKSSKYYASPGDHIKVSYKKVKTIDNKKEQLSFEFSGKGREKYQVRDLMNKEFTTLWTFLGKTNDMNMKDDSPALTQRLEVIYSSVRASNEKAKNIRKKYERRLGTELSNFYQLEFNMASNAFLTYVFGLYNRVVAPLGKKKIRDFYFLHKEAFRNDVDNPLIKYSHFYVFYRGDQLMYEDYLKNDEKKFLFEDRYESVKKIAHPDLRERLITDFLLNPYLQKNISSFERRDSCIEDAIRFVETIHLKFALSELLMFRKGEKLYDFSFQDTAGKSVTLQDMNGKVFMIKFYGEGCGGCANFAKRFKSYIYPEFSRNDDFKVVSVSVDRTKERWMKAMKSGLYTDEACINLNTGQEGLNHPMLKYYKVMAIPFILLVDKNGRLISKIESHSNSEIAEMIRKALRA